jgi:hypothetical protein
MPLHLELVAAIRQPQRTLSWPVAVWEQQVRLARRLRLLSRLAAAVEDQDLLQAVPSQPQRHLWSELRLSRWRTDAMRWAAERIGARLADRGYPIVLLKGAAYLSQGLSISRGRLPSDLDIMVPRDAMRDAQDCLRLDGWQEMELDAHDLRYYSEWSHEAPPMRHPAHRMELDLHHNILPPLGRPHVQAEVLFRRIQSAPWTGWSVLSPADQFLHAAAHLFCDSVFRDRLRDLVDLDGLARELVAGEQAWADVVARAQELGLAEQCALACHFLTLWFDTPLPDVPVSDALESSLARLTGRRPLLKLLSSALTPMAPDEEPGLRERVVDQVLLARYHLHRLPLRLLIPHLIHKASVRRREQSSSA